MTETEREIWLWAAVKVSVVLIHLAALGLACGVAYWMMRFMFTCKP